MKCKNCGTENSADAKICRECGEQLSSTNVISDYGKYVNKGFVPRISYKSPFKNYNVLWFIVSLPVLYIMIGFFGVGIMHETCKAPFEISVVVTILFGVCLLTFDCILLFKKNIFHVRNMKMLNETLDYDYLQSYKNNGDYLFFIKNGLWGLFNMKKFEIMIAAEYEGLEWKEKGTFIMATKNGEKFLIDIYGNKL